MNSRILFSTILVLHCVCAHLIAQTPQEIRRAFTEIRSDDEPYNACAATMWLYVHREKLKDQLMAELYKTDRQGRDAILLVLYSTESFVPDQRFARFIMFRLGEHDKYVALGDIASGDGSRAAHISVWNFIEKHLALFEPLLVNQIDANGDLRAIWATAWLMKKRGIFSKYARRFTPEVLATAVANLRNDTEEYNASWAARLFLLLGDQSLPALREAANSQDTQQKNFARALIDAISKGSRRAVGYLGLRVDLMTTPDGDIRTKPEWLDEQMDYYFGRGQESYP
jgi:hypothetical protein